MTKYEQFTIAGSDGRMKVFDAIYRRGPLAVSEIKEGTNFWAIFCVPAECTVPVSFPSSVAAETALKELIDSGVLSRIKIGCEEDEKDEEKIAKMVSDFSDIIEENGGEWLLEVEDFVISLFLGLMKFVEECGKEGVI